VTAVAEAHGEGTSPLAAAPRVVGGRYGLSSKEFTPSMVRAAFDNLTAATPANHFTVGIVDDVTHASPSLVIAYSHCIAHGYDMAQGAAQQKRAVESGVWPLFRYDPRRVAAGEPPLHLDYGPPRGRVADYMRNEARFRVIERTNPDRFRRFLKASQEAADERYAVYRQLAGVTVPHTDATVDEEATAPEQEG